MGLVGVDDDADGQGGHSGVGVGADDALLKQGDGAGLANADGLPDAAGVAVLLGGSGEGALLAGGGLGW